MIGIVFIVVCVCLVGLYVYEEIKHEQFMKDYYRQLREKRNNRQEEESVIDQYHLY